MHFNLTIVSHFNVIWPAKFHEIFLQFERVHGTRGFCQAKDSDVCWVVGRANSWVDRRGWGGRGIGCRIAGVPAGVNMKPTEVGNF